MEKNYQKILVAIDGSEQSKDALKEAVEIAKRNDANLFIMTATNSSMFAADAHAIEYLIEQDKVSAKNILKDAEQSIPETVHSDFIYVHGNHKGAIINQAEENDIDLIVMGATGKGAITRALIGSTTSYVVNHAPCNVLVVR